MPAASLLQPGAASANRAPPRASVSDESGLVDRRRWTSFLTWAFVLSEMAGRDGTGPRIEVPTGGGETPPTEDAPSRNRLQ